MTTEEVAEVKEKEKDILARVKESNLPQAAELLYGLSGRVNVLQVQAIARSNAQDKFHTLYAKASKVSSTQAQIDAANEARTKMNELRDSEYEKENELFLWVLGLIESAAKEGADQLRKAQKKAKKSAKKAKRALGVPPETG